MDRWEQTKIIAGIGSALGVAGFSWWIGGLVAAPEFPERRGYPVEGVPPVELAAMQRSWPGGGLPGEREELFGYMANIDKAVVPVAAQQAAGPAEPPPDLGTLLAGADPARGQRTSQLCAACHTFTQGGANQTGPNLFAVVGRQIGSHGGFSYSPAMAGHRGAWTYQELDTYLTSPSKAVPGNKMAFAGIRNPRDRANLIAYLASVTPGAPPFPPPQPAAAPPEVAGKEGAVAPGPPAPNPAAP